jgi:hypothetical protein
MGAGNPASPQSAYAGAKILPAASKAAQIWTRGISRHIKLCGDSSLGAIGIRTSPNTGTYFWVNGNKHRGAIAAFHGQNLPCGLFSLRRREPLGKRIKVVPGTPFTKGCLHARRKM